MKLREIAERLSCRLVGDGDIEILGVIGMEQAGPGQLTFLANPKYAPKAKTHAPPARYWCTSRLRESRSPS